MALLCLSKAVGKPYEIEIFRAGKREASNGIAYDFPVSALKEVVDTYDPGNFRAPLIVSHDTDGQKDANIAESELCYGVPDKLRLVGDRLKAVFTTIVPQAVEWIKTGMLHSISSSFYTPNSRHNPYPGKHSLRHIALLGKTPPAVKGLAPINLCEFSINNNLDGVLEFSIPMYDDANAIAAALFQRFREYLIDAESLEVADRVLPMDEIQKLRDCGSDWRKEVAMIRSQIYELQSASASAQEYPIYKESMKKKSDLASMADDAGMDASAIAESTGIDESDVAAFMDGSKKPSKKQKMSIMDALGAEYDEEEMDYQENLEQRLKALEIKEKALNKKMHDVERKEIVSFVEGLVQQGKVLAAKKDDTITLLLNTADVDKVEFSQSTVSPRQALMDMLNDQPAWNYGEAIASSETDPNGYHPQRFAGASSDSLDADAKIRAYCTKHNKNPDNIADYSEAMVELGITY